MPDEAKEKGSAIPGESPEAWLDALYGDLRRLAASFMADRDGTLQPTAVVHEAFIRLADRGDYADRSHFFASAARAMRHCLVDHARSRGRLKRGGDRMRLELDEDLALAMGRDSLDADELLDLNRALERLGKLQRRQGRVVELRVFGGLAMEEIAAELEVSKRTVEGDWAFSRAWLANQLSK